MAGIVSGIKPFKKIGYIEATTPADLFAGLHSVKVPANLLQVVSHNGKLIAVIEYDRNVNLEVKTLTKGQS